MVSGVDSARYLRYWPRLAFPERDALRLLELLGSFPLLEGAGAIYLGSRGPYLPLFIPSRALIPDEGLVVAWLEGALSEVADIVSRNRGTASDA